MNSDEREALIKEQAYRIGEELNGLDPNKTVAQLIVYLAELRVDVNYLLEF